MVGKGSPVASTDTLFIGKKRKSSRTKLHKFLSYLRAGLLAKDIQRDSASVEAMCLVWSGRSFCSKFHTVVILLIKIKLTVELFILKPSATREFLIFRRIVTVVIEVCCLWWGVSSQTYAMELLWLVSFYMELYWLEILNYKCTFVVLRFPNRPNNYSKKSICLNNLQSILVTLLSWTISIMLFRDFP